MSVGANRRVVLVGHAFTHRTGIRLECALARETIRESREPLTQFQRQGLSSGNSPGYVTPRTVYEM